MVELYAENQQERQDWLDTLGAVIQAHRRRMHVGGGAGKGALSTGGGETQIKTNPQTHGAKLQTNGNN